MKPPPHGLLPLLVMLVLPPVAGCGGPEVLPAVPPPPSQITDQRLALVFGGITALANGYDGVTEKIAILDVDRDRQADLVVPDNSGPTTVPNSTPNSGQSLLFLYGQSGGGFSAPRQLMTQQTFQSAHPLHLFRDRRASLLLTPRTSSLVKLYTLDLLLGDTLGGFATPTTLGSPDPITGVAVADRDGDGVDDIFTVHAALGKVGMYVGQEGGHFAPRVDFPAGVEPFVVQPADVSRDGRPDLLVLARSSDKKSYLLSCLLQAAGSYQAPQSLPIAGKPLQLKVGDLDRDGTPDVLLMAALNGTSTRADVLLINHGNGDGTFKLNGQLAITTGMPNTLVLADLDADGRLDVAYVSARLKADFSADHKLMIHLGRGDGTFEAGREFSLFPVPVAATLLEAVDYDHDRRVDLIAIVQYGGDKWTRSLVLLHNVSAAQQAARE